VLGTVGAAVLAERGVISGKSTVDRILGSCVVDVTPPRNLAGRIVTGTMVSARRRATVGYAIAYPPGHGPGDDLPACLALHGYGGDGFNAITGPDYPGYLADAVAGGTPPFVLAGIDGGAGYWHPHGTDDPLGMLTDEYLPFLGTQGLRVERPAVIGMSMGGYGALMCSLTAPGRFVSVVANSPAFWRSYHEANHVNPGAFDSAEEWSQYGNLLARADDVAKLPVQIYVGESDLFAPAIRALRDRMSGAADRVHISKGCHDNTFWRSQAPAQIRAIGAALAS
jgi:enterochelin esterase-like enzyme